MLKNTIKIGIVALLVASSCQMVYGKNVKTGKASWYSVESCRKEGTSGTYTASGDRFYNEGMTCAMRSYKFGGIYKVTNTNNGKSVIVGHNDFGPNKRLHDQGRIVDLSKGAFAEIADLKQGVIPVIIEAI